MGERVMLPVGDNVLACNFVTSSFASQNCCCNRYVHDVLIQRKFDMTFTKAINL